MNSVTNQVKADAEDQYVKYISHSSGKSRVVRIREVQEDPFAPAQYKKKKAPPGPGSPPEPITRSPTNKLTLKDQKEFNIPPCISNWKNSKGYTIPIEMRLSADGRNLKTPTVNERFSHVANALYISEKQARRELEEKARIQKTLKFKEMQRKEEEMRERAREAREQKDKIFGSQAGEQKRESEGGGKERRRVSGFDQVLFSEKESRNGDLPDLESKAGYQKGDSKERRKKSKHKKKKSRKKESKRHDSENSQQDSKRSKKKRKKHRKKSKSRKHRPHSSHSSNSNSPAPAPKFNAPGQKPELTKAEKQRAMMRHLIKREAEREHRLAKVSSQKGKMIRERERQLGEQLALGQFVSTNRPSGLAVDERLMGVESGLDSGFKGKSNPENYSKPLFNQQIRHNIYAGAQETLEADMAGDGEENDYFAQIDAVIGKNKKKGKKGGRQGLVGSKRSEPVQFEKYTGKAIFGGMGKVMGDGGAKRIKET